MLTYITGDFMISAIAEGISRNLSERGGTVKTYFSGGVTKADIISAAQSNAHVIVCWKNCFPINVPAPDLLINSVHPMAIIKAPENIAEILGEFTQIGTLVIPPSQFSQPSRNISMIDGDGQYIANQQPISGAA